MTQGVNNSVFSNIYSKGFTFLSQIVSPIIFNGRSYIRHSQHHLIVPL